MAPTTGTCMKLLDGLHGAADERRTLRRSLGPEARAGVALLSILVEEGPQRPSALAERLHVDSSVISRHLACLEREELAERTLESRDRRSHAVRVTDAGREACARARRQAADTMAALLDGWSDDDAAALAGALTRLSQCVPQLAAPPPADVPNPIL